MYVEDAGSRRANTECGTRDADPRVLVRTEMVEWAHATWLQHPKFLVDPSSGLSAPPPFPGLPLHVQTNSGHMPFHRYSVPDMARARFRRADWSTFTFFQENPDAEQTSIDTFKRRACVSSHRIAVVGRLEPAPAAGVDGGALLHGSDENFLRGARGVRVALEVLELG